MRLVVPLLLSAMLLTVAAVVFVARCGPPIAAALQWRETWSSEALAQSKREAEPLLEAIRRYCADHGDLPESLDELSPAYITEIPRPLVGEEQWHLRRHRDDPNEFYLRVESRYSNYAPPAGHYSGPLALSYSSRSGRWIFIRGESF